MANRLQSTIIERDGANQALATCKRAFAQARMRWFADRVKWTGAEIRVTVRFAEYKDFELARSIEKIVKEHMEWPVTLDGGNNPTLRPQENFKVIFESGISRAFDEIASAFSDGALVAGNVGVRAADRATDGHLVIEVLPTVTP